MRALLLAVLLSSCTTIPNHHPRSIAVTDPQDWMFHIKPERQAAPYTAEEWKRFHRGKA